MYVLNLEIQVEFEILKQQHKVWFIDFNAILARSVFPSCLLVCILLSSQMIGSRIIQVDVGPLVAEYIKASHFNMSMKVHILFVCNYEKRTPAWLYVRGT